MAVTIDYDENNTLSPWLHFDLEYKTLKIWAMC